MWTSVSTFRFSLSVGTVNCYRSVKCCSGEGGKGLSRFILENKSLRLNQVIRLMTKTGARGVGRAGGVNDLVDIRQESVLQKQNPHITDSFSHYVCTFYGSLSLSLSLSPPPPPPPQLSPPRLYRGT